MSRIKGFNDKEQRIYEILKDGKDHSIAEMKNRFLPTAKKHCQETYETFEDHNVDSHAQSFVRNGIRRLIRDGWAEKNAYGTYRLTRNGKAWVKAGKDETVSFGTKRGRKPGTNNGKSTSKKAKTADAKASTKKVSAKKASTKKASTKKASTKKVSAKKVSAKKASTKKVSAKSKKGTNGAAKKAGKDKAAAIKKRVAKQAATEKAKQSIAQDANA